MAFVNDLLKDEEIKEYKLSEYNIMEPGAGTIDREKNLRLFYNGHPRGDMVTNYFIFDWKGTVIRATMNKILKEDSVLWQLRAIDIPVESGLRKNEVLEELRNAMRVYGFTGYSIVKYDDVDVEIDF